MEYKVVVVGIGPGSPEYLIPAGKKMIEQARVLVGSKRALDTFGREDMEQYIIDKDIQGVLEFIARKLCDSDVVVLVSGDPGFYSLLIALRRRFAADQLTVIPGISSAQLAFARLGEPWQDAGLISMHGRRATDGALTYSPGKRLGILTDNNNNPAYIAETLLSAGWPETAQVWLCANLSYPEETIAPFCLEEVRGVNGFEHCVMVVMA
jgi:cobalt-precorrin-7 (C5)-methyltransferase